MLQRRRPQPPLRSGYAWLRAIARSWLRRLTTPDDRDEPQASPALLYLAFTLALLLAILLADQYRDVLHALGLTADALTVAEALLPP